MTRTVDRNKSPEAAGFKIGKVPVSSTPNSSNTTEPHVRIDSEVSRRIRQHARAHLKTEVCGVLIGDSSEGTIDIRASIEALNAAQGGTHVTFTQDAWEEIYKVKDELYPDERIVGWYHSHPGFGIFLSEHDLFIQENFFSSVGQVAWVYDPHSDDEGCFGWVSGKVARLTAISTLYRGGGGVEHATKGHDSDFVPNGGDDEDELISRSPRSSKVPLWITMSRIALSHFVVLLAGFAVSYFFFPRLVALLPDPASRSMMVVDYHALRAYLDGKGTAPKPLDVFHLPATIPNDPPSAALPGDPALPSSGFVKREPSAPAAPDAMPPTAQSTKPQPASAGSQR